MVPRAGQGGANAALASSGWFSSPPPEMIDPDPNAEMPMGVEPVANPAPPPGNFFGDAPIPGYGHGPSPLARLNTWWHGLPWANQMQHAPEQGDPYANGEWPGNTGGQVEGGINVSGRPFGRGGIPRRPGNLGATAANAARSPVRGVGTHYDFTRGTYVQNDNATGAQFNPQAANALLMWYTGATAGNPNRLNTPDAGPDQFLNGVMQLDEEGHPYEVGNRVQGVRRLTAPLQTTGAGAAAYNRAVAAARLRGGGG